MRERAKSLFEFGVRLGMVLLLCVLVTVAFFVMDSRDDGMADLANLPAQQGLVVFTGGTNRIEEGALALKHGYQGSVLVTGVYPGVRVESLFGSYDLLPEQQERITLDHAAQSTAGNVIETAKWAEKEGINTLCVVTSTYHTARSRLLFRRYAPTLTVQMHQVHPDKAGLEIWIKEYIKYALVLLGVEAFLPATQEA